jgi:import inner membrane translocase subunit TIM22
MATPIPLLAPLYLPGQEPVRAGTTPEERAEMQQAIKYQKILAGALESCPLKVVMSGGAGKSDGRPMIWMEDEA